MTPLAAKFADLKSKGERALVLFITGGDPPLDELPSILETLVEGGADVVEIGIPFSDPIADGPVIQASSQRALDLGVSPAAIFSKLQETAVDAPLVAMGYTNTILRRGYGNAADDLKRAGFSGSILSDLIPEEAVDWCTASWAAGLDNIFLVAPTSPDARIAEVCRRASGFIYAVSRTGVTGAREEAPKEARALVERVRACSELPVCVGFGISSPEQVRTVAEFADGVVIGSRLVDLLHREWREGKGRAAVLSQIREWKSATR